jgi:hypothetical protein
MVDVSIVDTSLECENHKTFWFVRWVVLRKSANQNKHIILRRYHNTYLTLSWIDLLILADSLKFQ